jgi:glutathione peroxidase
MIFRSRPSLVSLALSVLCGACSGVPADPVDDRSYEPTVDVSGIPDVPVEQMPKVASGLYELAARSLEGEPAPLDRFAGQVTLIVNVASQCGYTPQYAGLQALHTRFQGQGFEVLGFPSNEFGRQEPGDATSIREFCTSTFQVSFPMFEKCETQAGPDQSPVYAYLEQGTQRLPVWNFCKYLVGRNGQVLGFYESATAPDDEQLLARIEAALEER